jgi:hypothetical protein
MILLFYERNVKMHFLSGNKINIYLRYPLLSTDGDVRLSGNAISVKYDLGMSTHSSYH